MSTSIPITDSGLIRLLAWLSPSFPVGAYAYSHGAEYAVESGRITHRQQAESWVSFVLEYGSARVDGTLFVQAYKAALSGDVDAFLEVARWADALKGTAELGLESRAQGQAFCDTVSNVWPDQRFSPLMDALKAHNIPPAYAVSVAAAAACAGVGLAAGLAAYLHAFAANIVSAIVRLVPLGQTDGQRIIAALEPVIERALADALTRNPADMGSAAFAMDWMSMQHETQYSRLFRS